MDEIVTCPNLVAPPMRHAGKERPGRTGKSKAGAGASDGAGALISRTAGLPDCWVVEAEAEGEESEDGGSRESSSEPFPIRPGGFGLVSQVGHLWGQFCATSSTDRPAKCVLA